MAFATSEYDQITPFTFQSFDISLSETGAQLMNLNFIIFCQQLKSYWNNEYKISPTVTKYAYLFKLE